MICVHFGSVKFNLALGNIILSMLSKLPVVGFPSASVCPDRSIT